MGPLATQAGTAMTAGITVPIMAVAGFAMKSASDVNGALRTITRETGLTGAAADSMKTSFKTVASEVPSSFAEVADSMTLLIQRTGLTGTALETLTKQSLDMSRMMGTDVKETTDAVTTAFVAFGVPADQMGTEMDRLFVLFQKTGVPMDQVTAAMDKMAPTSRALGLTFDETAATISKFAEAGLPARQTVTMLTGFVNKMASEGKDAGVEWKLMFERIKTGTQTKEDVALFGASWTKVSDAVKTGKFDINSLTTAMNDSKGTIEDTSHKTASFGENMKTAMNQLEVAMQPLGSAIYEAFASIMPLLTPLIGFIASVVTAFTDLPGPIKEVILVVALIVAAGGPLLVLIGLMAPGIALVSTAAAFLATQLGLVSAAEDVTVVSSGAAQVGLDGVAISETAAGTAGTTGAVGIRGYAAALGELVIVLGIAYAAQLALNAVMTSPEMLEARKQGTESGNVLGTQNDIWNTDVYNAISQFTGGNQKPVTIGVHADMTAFNTTMAAAISEHREAKFVAMAITDQAKMSLDSVTKEQRIADITANALTDVANSDLTATEKKQRTAEILAAAQTAVANSNLDTTAKQRMATILADAQTAAANGTLDAAAIQRIATIVAQANTGDAAASLAVLAAPRSTTLTVYIQQVGKVLEPSMISGTGQAEGGIIKAAMGGIVQAAGGYGVLKGPQLVLAGEAGDEAFIPLKGGKVPVSINVSGGSGMSIPSVGGRLSDSTSSSVTNYNTYVTVDSENVTRKVLGAIRENENYHQMGI